MQRMYGLAHSMRNAPLDFSANLDCATPVEIGYGVPAVDVCHGRNGVQRFHNRSMSRSLHSAHTPFRDNIFFKRRVSGLENLLKVKSLHYLRQMPAFSKPWQRAATNRRKTGQIFPTHQENYVGNSACHISSHFKFEYVCTVSCRHAKNRIQV